MPINIPAPQESGDKIIPLSAGISMQWLHEGKILAVTALNITREAIDVWTEAIIAAELTYFKDRPVRLLLDIGMLPPTPYARQKSEEIVKQTAHLYGRTAVVLRPSLTTQTIRFFVERILRRSGSSFERRIFLSRADALTWLLTPHPKEK